MAIIDKFQTMLCALSHAPGIWADLEEKRKSDEKLTIPEGLEALRKVGNNMVPCFLKGKPLEIRVKPKAGEVVEDIHQLTRDIMARIEAAPLREDGTRILPFDALIDIAQLIVKSPVLGFEDVGVKT